MWTHPKTGWKCCHRWVQTILFKLKRKMIIYKILLSLNKDLNLPDGKRADSNRRQSAALFCMIVYSRNRFWPAMELDPGRLIRV